MVGERLAVGIGVVVRMGGRLMGDADRDTSGCLSVMAWHGMGGGHATTSVDGDVG